MALAAGRLRHTVRIEEFTQSRDSDGYPTEYWSEWATVAAEVVPLSAREFVQSAQVQSQVVARITIRYREGLSATMRIIFRGQVYNIAGVLPDNWSGLEYITIPVSAGVNEG